MTKKGSSLIIALLMLAVISTASFGIARFSMVEMSTSASQAVNTKAYYLAEAGIEESLLRWRYDHSAEIGTGSAEDSKVWERINLTDANLTSNMLNSGFTSDVTFDKDYIGSTIYNKVSQSVGLNVRNIDDLVSLFNLGTDAEIGAYVAARPDLEVTKDNKITFGFDQAAAYLDVAWRWQAVAASGESSAELDWDQKADNNFGVEARLYVRKIGGDTLLAKKLFSPKGGNNEILNSDSGCDTQQYCLITNIKSQMNSSAISGETYLTLTPIGANIVVGAFGHNASGAAENYIDSITHLESVGVTRGRYKGLQVKLDKNSGRILGLYDYVLFEGE